MNSFDSTDSFSRRRAPRFDKPLDFSVLHNSSSSTLSPSYHQNNFQGPKSAFVLPSHDWPWQDQLSAPAYSVNHGQHSSTPRMSSQWCTVAPNPWPVWNSAQNYTTSGQRQLSYRNSNDGFNATNVFSPRGTGFWDKEMNVFNFDTHAVKSDGNLGGSPVDSGSSYRPPRTRRRLPSCVECVFCKNNKEKEEVYKTHILKDPEGNVMCPKLRAYNCPVCNNGGGPHAHTIRYCPRNRPNGWRGNNHV